MQRTRTGTEGREKEKGRSRLARRGNRRTCALILFPVSTHLQSFPFTFALLARRSPSLAIHRCEYAPDLNGFLTECRCADPYILDLDVPLEEAWILFGLPRKKGVKTNVNSF